MQPVASTSKLPQRLPKAARQTSSVYLSIKGVPSTVLPADVERFLGKLNVPSTSIKHILRGLNDDYTPTDEYCIECNTVEAAEDAIASAKRISKGHATTFNMFGGQLASLRYVAPEHLKHLWTKRGLIQPHFGGRTVRIGGVPKEAQMWAIRHRMSKQEAKIVEWPTPYWYRKTLREYPTKINQALTNSILPLKTGSTDFLAYLVRLESEQEAWRMQRLWHGYRTKWDGRSLAEVRDGEPPQETPAYRLTADVVY